MFADDNNTLAAERGFRMNIGGDARTCLAFEPEQDSARAKLDHDLYCNVFGLLKRLDDSSVAYLEDFSLSNTGKRIMRYKPLPMRTLWETGTGTLFTHCELEAQESDTLRRVARRTASVMFQIWLIKKVQLRSFEMRFGRDIDGKIRLVDIPPQSWHLAYEGRALNLIGDSQQDYADALPDLRLAVSLSSDFRAMNVDL